MGVLEADTCCALLLFFHYDYLFSLCAPYLVVVGSGREKGEGDGGSCHGVGGRHPVLGIRPRFQLDDRWREGPRPLQDVLGDLPYVHYYLRRGKVGQQEQSPLSPLKNHLYFCAFSC